MRFTSLLRRKAATLTSPAGRAAFRPRLEYLEDRTLPAVVSLPAVALGPSATPSNLVGDPVTWVATPSAPDSTLVYQFLVGPAGGPLQVVRDFSPGNSFTWDPMQEGTYNVQVIAKDSAGIPELVSTSYVANTRVTGSDAVVTQMANPLVALYSAPPAPAGVTSMYVQFSPAGASPSWKSTNTLPVVPGQSTNFVVAGLLPNTTYQMRDVLSDGTTSPLVYFTTGTPPASLTFPAFTVSQAPDSGADLSQDMALAMLTSSGSSTVTVQATDLQGRVVWYLDPKAMGLTSMMGVSLVPGGTVLLTAASAPAGAGAGDTLVEADLAGNVVRETNVSAVNAQLAAMGRPAIVNFNHDAQRLPNGETAVIAASQRTVLLNGTPTLYTGDMVLVLDQDFQVVWAWDPFQWLDTNRLPTLGEGPGDWMHSNSIAWSPVDGDLVLSMRSQDWVIKIAYQGGNGDGHVVWRLGAGGDFAINSTDPSPWFSHQHDVRYINDNTLVLFDDGNTRRASDPNADSRGQVLVLDETTMQATLALNADLGNYSSALGSAQQLPNGDFVFDSGIQTGNRAIFGQSIEVHPDGSKAYVLQVASPDYRTYRTASLDGETVTAVSSSANPALPGQPVTFTATVSAAGAPTPLTPGGSVTFWDGTTVLGTAPLDGTGQAAFVAPDLALGLHPITAVYGGSASFDNSTSAALAEDVSLGPQAQVAGGGTAVPNNGSFPFGTALPGAPVTQTFTVTNGGNQTLTLGAVSVTGAGFTLSAPLGSTSLAPGASTTFAVQMSAATAGSYSGSVSFTTNDPHNATFNFAVTRTVATSVVLDNGQAAFSESGPGWAHYAGAGYNSTLDYAAAGSGANTATWQLTGLAAGTYDAQVTWTAVSNHASNATYSVYDGGTLLGTVAVNQQQAPSGTTVNGTAFQSLGLFQVTSGTLTVVLSDSANGYVIADAARVVQAPAVPQAQVTAGSQAVAYGGSAALGTSLAGQAAAAQTFTVTNTGGATLTLSDPITLPVGFILASDFGATSLAPGQSTTFAVQLDTSAPAGNYGGTLSFGTNDANSPFTFALSGTVTNSAVIDNGQAGFSESGTGWGHFTGGGYGNTLDYAAAGSGANTATWQLTGLAAGTYDAQVTWTAVANHASNATYSVYDGDTLLATVTVNQRQAPAAADGSAFQSLGVFEVSSGTLTVVLSDNANGYVIADAVLVEPVQVEGIGGLPTGPVTQISDGGTVITDGGSDSFGTALVGSPTTRTFTVKNTGGDTLTLSDPIALPAGFSLASDFGSTSLAPGESTTFAVQLDTSVAGSYSGTVSFGTNDANSPFTFALSGTVTSSTVIDNGQSGFAETGSGWTHHTGAGYDGALDYAAADGGANTATWQLTGLGAGAYDVQMAWTPGADHASNATYSVYDGGTLLGTVTVNQQQAPSGTTVNGSPFQSLGLFQVGSGTLTVVLSDSANGYVIADALSVTAVPAVPQVQLTAGSQAVAYGGSAALGTSLVGQAAAQTLTVTNTGGATLTLSGPITLPAGFILASDFGTASLAPGQSTTFAVRLDTSVAGSYSGTASFGTNDANSPFTFALSGTVTSSVVLDNGQSGFSESGTGWTHYAGAGYGSTLDYAAAGSGSSTATWQLTGLAAGSYDAQVTWTAVANHASNATYSVYDGSTLLANVTVNQQRAPSGTTVNGVPFQSLGHFPISSGTLRIVLSDGANGYVIADALSVTAVPAVPLVQVTAGSQAVAPGGSVALSALVGQSASQTFTLTNTGAATLTLSGPITLPAGFILTSDLGTTSLAPGQSTTFAVQLDTSAAGSYSGTASFGTNVSGANPFTFTLSGMVTTSAAIDNGQAGFSETGSGWNHHAGAGYGNTLDYAAPGSGANTATWQLTSLAAGPYDVQVTWTAVSNHATNATYSVYDGGTLLGTVTVNQRQAPSGPTVNGSAFQSLGVFPVSSGTLTVVLSDSANGYVIADAARIVQVPTVPLIQVSAGSQPVASGGSVALGTFLVGQAATQTFTLTNTGGATLTLSGPITLPAGFILASDFGTTSLAPGQSTTFAVQLDTSAAGIYSGTASFGTNVGGAGAFSFTLHGMVALSVIIDNGQAGFTETGSGWTQYTGAGNGNTVDYAAAGTGLNTATWQLVGLAVGTYDVQQTWTAVFNHATNATYSVYDGDTLLATVTVNQQQGPVGTTVGGSVFQSLGQFEITSGTLRVTLSDNANGYVIADAMRVVVLTLVQ